MEAARFLRRAIDAARHLAGLDERELETAYEALSDAWNQAGEFREAAAANASADGSQEASR